MKRYILPIKTAVVRDGECGVGGIPQFVYDRIVTGVRTFIFSPDICRDQNEQENVAAGMDGIPRFGT